MQTQPVHMLYAPQAHESSSSYTSTSLQPNKGDDNKLLIFFNSTDLTRGHYQELMDACAVNIMKVIPGVNKRDERMYNIRKSLKNYDEN